MNALFIYLPRTLSPACPSQAPSPPPRLAASRVGAGPHPSSGAVARPWLGRGLGGVRGLASAGESSGLESETRVTSLRAAYLPCDLGQETPLL